MTPVHPQQGADLKFGEDDKWKADPVYAERDALKAENERLRVLLAEWHDHGDQQIRAMRTDLRGRTAAALGREDRSA